MGVKLIIKFFISAFLLSYVVGLQAAQEIVITPNRFDKLFENYSALPSLSPQNLPSPFDFLLIQPLMTLGVENYYQRSAKIKAIFTKNSIQNEPYSRAIILFIDRNKKRNNPAYALSKNEMAVVEFALININFQALPPPIVEAIKTTDRPLGGLLAQYKIKTIHTNRHYFAVKCSEMFAHYLQCRPNSKVYGRINTLNKADNKQWIAHVVEILSGITCADKQCKKLNKMT